MRLVVPYTRRIKKVTAALDATGYPYEAVDVSEHWSRYFYVLKELWEAGESFMTNEHDIVPKPTTFKELDDCPCDWDVAPYEYSIMDGGLYAGLGCCKFTSRIISRYPDAMEQVGEMFDTPIYLHICHQCKSKWLDNSRAGYFCPVCYQKGVQPKVTVQTANEGHKPKEWCRLDGWLKSILVESGERPHCHEIIEHIGDGLPSCPKCRKEAELRRQYNLK